MFDLLKFFLLAAGCVSLYGLSTGQDLNELFAQVSSQVIPVAKEVLSGIINIIKQSV